MTNKCVCCGSVIPEGRLICPNCEAGKVLGGLGIGVKFVYGDNPCLHIDNSYLITSGMEIKNILNYIRTLDGYKKLQSCGYTRTPNSEYREWRGHNTLYRLGIRRNRTGSVDIDQNEPMWRRLIYAVLSIF